MSTETGIERRLTAVEAAVAELRSRLATAPPPDWLERITGSFKDEPAFEDLLELGREFRAEGRPEEDGS